MVVVVAFLLRRRRRTTTRVDAAVLRVWASEMFKNQLQELAQRSCFNLPAYACVREGPDHAPRFRASVNFNGEIFQGPNNCTTLRQAEHAAAEVALSNLSSRAPSRSIAARVLDETGVYKNLLQETTHRAGLKLPVYTTVRSGPGHQPVFTSIVELAGMCFGGEPAKTKKQAEKNAAMTAWSALKQMPDLESLSRPRDLGDISLCCGGGGGEEQEQVVRVLSNFKPKEENTYARQREHYHPQQQKNRRKLVVGYNEGSTSSASPHRSPRFQQPWRPLEPLGDVYLMNSSQQQQKKSTFLAPAVSTAPKVLPPLLYPLHSPVSSQEPFFHPSSPQIPALVGNSSSHARLQEIQTLLEGKNGERVHETSTLQGKASSPSSVLAYSKPFAQPNTSVFAARPFSPPPYLKTPIGAASIRNFSAITVPRMMNTGGVHSAGIAPAVQIRSVIPVCAAPPPTTQPPQPPPKPTCCGGATTILKKEAEEDIPAATSKLNKLQL